MEIWEEPLWSWNLLNRGSPTGTTFVDSFANRNGFRPRFGRSDIFWASITCPLEALELSSCGTSSVTSMLCDTVPSSSWTSAVIDA